jgi:hypothetical protein
MADAATALAEAPGPTRERRRQSTNALSQLDTRDSAAFLNGEICYDAKAVAGWEGASVKTHVAATIAGLVFSLWSAQASGVVTVTIGDAAGLPGSDVDVTVGLSGGEGNVASVQLDVLYPNTILSIVPADDCVLAERLSESLSLFAFHPAPGRARFLVIDLNFPGELISNGDLFTCAFHIAPLPSGFVADLVGDRLEVSDDLAVPLPATVEDGTVTVLLCGNGAIDAGEACDDGSDNGSSISCCTATCQFVPDGEASCDGNECTRPDTCLAGVCTPGSCADGGACTACGGTCVDTGSSCNCE